jgi:hypothetical protein
MTSKRRCHPLDGWNGHKLRLLLVPCLDDAVIPIQEISGHAGSAFQQPPRLPVAPSVSGKDGKNENGRKMLTAWRAHVRRLVLVLRKRAIARRLANLPAVFAVFAGRLYLCVRKASKRS